MRLRKKQVKNFVCLLLLSNGTPMFRAGDEFLQTQFGDANPYNVDGSRSWLDWSRLEAHNDVFRFFQMMIAFRKSHPSLGRSVFWRDDVKWYGVSGLVDCSDASHSLAYCLHGASANDNDLYVMTNSYWLPMAFTIQEGEPGDWTRIVDTDKDDPNDFADTPRRSSRPAVLLLYAATSIGGCPGSEATGTVAFRRRRSTKDPTLPLSSQRGAGIDSEDARKAHLSSFSLVCGTEQSRHRKSVYD